MPESKPKPDLRIYLSFEESPNYGDGSRFAHVYAEPMILERGKYGRQELTLWQPGSYEITDYGDSVRALKGLRVSSQASNSGGGGGLYGWKVEYAGSMLTVDLRDAEAMLPWLRKIDREMGKLKDQFGYAQDFATYLAYFAAVVTPKQPRPFLRRVTGVDRDQDYEGTGYRSMDAGAMRMWLGDTLKAWRERHGIRVAEDA